MIMENLKAFQYLIVAISVSLLFISPVKTQISTPCTPSMINSFTPCLNFITGSSSGNGASPTSGCCMSLKSLVGASMDCACLVITANVPFQLPINRTLAISLPKACHIGGVPVQCKAAASVLPAPGPVLLGPSLPPTTSSNFSPQSSKASIIAPSPDSETNFSESPSVGIDAPTTTPGIRPVLIPTSDSSPSHVSFSPALLFITGLVIFKFYY